MENVIASWARDMENRKDIVLGIYDYDQYIGNIGLHGINSANSSGMIGYWLSQDRQGRGVMTGCVRAMTDHAFHALGLNRTYIHCAAGNRKSRAIPERLGYVKEGVLRDGECLYGIFHDLIVYGMLKRDWLKAGM
jgi:ribosomal-protein-serine acetyltransferase